MDLIAQPFALLLHFLYDLTGNFGWSIIVLTVIIRTALIPLTLPALKSQKRMKALQPELKRLRAEHDGNATAFGQAQMALFKEHKINPLAGCLPTLFQIGILFALYHVLRQFIGEGQQGLIENIYFFGLDLTVPDKSYVLPVLAAGLQLLLSVMLLPGLESHEIYPEKSDSRKVKALNKDETQKQDMAETMQKQMMFVFPVMTGIMAASFPAGLGVYWVSTTAFSLIQQYFVSGWGGLARVKPLFEKVVGAKSGAFSAFSKTSVTREETLEKITKHGQKQKGSPDAFAAAFAKIADGKNAQSASTVQVKNSEKRKQVAKKQKPGQKKRSKKRNK